MEIRKTRICVASTGLGHVVRGVESWAQDLASALWGRGEQVVLCKGAGEARQPYEKVVPCWTRNSRAAERISKCLPASLRWRIGFGSGYATEQTSFVWNLLGVLRRQRIDVVHVQDPQLALHLHHASRVGLCRSAVLFGHVTEEPYATLAKLPYLHHVAPWHRDQAEREIGPRPRWSVIPNFVDPLQFQPNNDKSAAKLRLGFPSSAFVVLASSAIKKKHKRVHHLIDEVAAAVQQRPGVDVRFVVAGGASDDTESLIKRGHERLGRQIQFFVQHPRDEMPALYQAADVFVHGSLFEMFGTVLLEAAASGVPCITHNHPVMKWVVGPGGVTTDTNAVGNLSTELLRLIDDGGRRSELSSRARQHCLNRFSTDVIVEQFVRVYRDLSLVSGVAA